MNRLNMIKAVITLTMVAIMLTGTAAATDWSAFQKDSHNTGLTSDKAPITNPYGNGISWERSFAANFDEAPVVVGDTVYVVGADNKVRAMNKTTGDVKWETSTSGGGFLLGNMGAGNGMIFVPTSDGKIFGIDDATGAVVWSATESGQMNTPVVYDDHKIYFGDWGGNNAYYCYSDTGTEIWQRTSNSGSGYYWAGAATIGDYLVYGDDAGHLTSVYKTNGTIVHEIDVSTEFGVTANEIRSSICYVESLDRIYFTSKGGYMYALGMNNDGTFDTTDKHHAYIGYSTSTPAVYNNKVYVGAGGMYGGGDGISCLDANLTDEDWHFAAAAGAVQSSPAITTAYDDGDGEVYIYVTTNAAAGKVYCVNELGVEQWSWGESGKTDWTLCGVAISDGWIFYGTDSKYVFGFATTESLSGSTPTPPTSFLLSGNITYDTGNPVMNPVVTVTNLETPEDFTVKTDAGSNLYLTLTNSGHASSGNTIRINASDGVIFNEVDYMVTAADINGGGFVLDILLVSGGMPDLNVTDKYEEWVNIPEKTYNVTYTVENTGSADADASNTSLRIDGVEVATDHVPELLIGASYTGTLGPFTLSGNNDTIEICADGDGVITELDETNNCLENVLEAPGMPDLIVWVALKTPGYVNEDNILGVRVKNAGTVDAGSFNVSLAIDGTPVPAQTVPPLAAGDATELEYAWMPTELGTHLLSATVDTNNDVSESNETNNDFARTSVIIKRTDWHQFHYDVVHSGFSPSGAPDTNETHWISDEISAIGGTSTVVADGKVFAYGGPTGWTGGDGALYCLDEFTGAILWNISIPVPAYGSWSSPAYHNGRVFTSTDIEAGCYNAATGEQIWAFENPTNDPSVNGGPVVADGKVIVNDWQAGHYHCLDEETGELLWTFTEEQTGDWGVGYTQGVPAYEDGKFYLTTWLYVGGNVYCVDADTGDVIWNQTTPLDTCGSPAVVDGTVYVTNYDFYGYGAIYAMNATNGSILWQQTIQRSDSTPAVAYGNVYVTGGSLGYSDRQTYCFNATTGNLTWSTDTADEIGAWTCSVAVADGMVFAGTEGGDSFDYAGTYALDAFTGDLIWSYPEGGSSPAVADDTVFTIGGGRVYAFYSGAVDNKTTVDIPVSGTVSGSYMDTQVSDDAYESITEVESGGKPASRYSHLEHKWTVDVTGGSDVTFYLEAYRSSSSDGDNFVFAYSTDDITYTDMATVTKVADDGSYQTFDLPSDLSGTVYIRVKDTDRTAGNKALDTIYIDHLFIRSLLAPPSYGITVTVDEASQTVSPGNSTTYTVRVKNTGDLDASYSAVMSGTAVDEATIDVSPLNWNTGTLSPNAENVQTVTVSTTASTPETTYTLTATATCVEDASVTDSAASELVVSSAGYADDKANGDTIVAGTVSGSYVDTQVSDDVYESITEVESGGKPASRYSYLEHKWTVDVTGGSDVTFYLEAYRSSSSDGDDFVFAYSTDDITYTDMATVTKVADDGSYQTFDLPSDLSGTVYIRVKDTDRTAGNKALDTIYIDQMFIRSGSAPPCYGVTVTIDEASQTVSPGNSTTYTVRVKNTGDFDASYSVVMGGTAVDESTIDVSPLSWNTGTLAPNAENVQTVTVSTTASTTETTYTLTATATCDQDATVIDSAASELVVSSVTNEVHIVSIDMSLRTAGPNTNAVALVTIVDAAGVPVGDATVEGHWSDATSDTDSDLTDVNGEVALDSDKVKNPPGGTVFTFTVDDVSLTGWTYDPAANAETSDSITV